MAGNAHDELTDEQHDNPWTQPLFIASAIVVAIVITLGLLLAFTGGDTNTAPRPAQPPLEAAEPEPTETSSQNGGCDLPPGDQTPPTQPPPSTKWELVGTMAAPTAPSRYGPGRVERGFRSCFVRSPMGALYAAVNVVALLSTTEHQEAALRELTAAGPGREAALAELHRDGPSADSSTRMQVAGFSVVNYDRDAAVIDMAFRVATPRGAGKAHLTVTMRWSTGDWRLGVARSGRPFDSVGSIPDFSSYVAWSGA